MKKSEFNETVEKRKYNKRFIQLQNLKHRDHTCCLLGAFGFSTKRIMEETGLSVGQVGYRLKHAEICRADIRNGVSPFSKVLFQSARDLMDKRLINHLRDHA